MEPKPKSQQLSSISNKYVEDNELRDTPARLFRQLLNRMEMTPQYWSKLVRDYLTWSVMTTDKERAKAERIHQSGNIKTSYFQSATLTFNKLMGGLSILQFDEVEIIIRARKGTETFEVSETLHVMGPPKPKSTDT